jgi:hypothetical protein
MCGLSIENYVRFIDATGASSEFIVVGMDVVIYLIYNGCSVNRLIGH